MRGKRNLYGSFFLRLTVFSMVAWFFVAFTGAIPANADTVQTAIVAAVEADYSGSAVSIVPVDPDDTTGTRDPENELLAQDISDITVASYGRYFYLISRYGENSVAKLDMDEPESVIWQYSTEGDETNSNPYDMIFVSDEKAYIIRYGSTKAWIVNPSTESEDDFKTGELDLSSYVDGTDTDGVPEMAGAVIVDDQLFIFMQRLVSYAPTELKSYVAVFDTSTDEEIDTYMGEGDLLGIPLDVKDPLAIQYLEESDTVYVQAIGYYAGYGYPDYEYDGGIISINPDTYETDVVLDDGDSTSHPYGNISGMAIVSSTKGYFVGYDGWGDNTLYSFDPSGADTTISAISGLEGIGIAGMESGIYTDKNGMLWVCNQTDAQVDILDTSTDTIDESVSTSLNPLKVVFASYEEDDGDDADDSDDTDDDDSCFIKTAGAGSGMTVQSLFFVLMIGGVLTALCTSRRSRD